MLQEFLQKHGEDLEVCMTEGGYYSSGPFADLYEEPEIQEITFTYEELKPGFDKPFSWNKADYIKKRKTQTYIVLGNSYQNY